MNLITGRNTPGFAKDTVYRFAKMLQINWIRFTTLLSSRIIGEAVVPLNSEDRANVFIIDNSMFERNRSKRVELLAKVYDHAKHVYRLGFRMLTLGWSDGSTFLPVSSVLLSSENRKNRVNEAADVDKRTVGYKRRLLSMQKGTQAILELLKAAAKAAIPAKVVYVRNRNKRKEYLCLISTDTALDENEIIRIYGIWDIEVFFKVCKSYLNLSRECNDTRSLGELFLYFSDEMTDITWIQAFQMLLQMFRTTLSDNTELSDDKINELVDTFMNTLPALLKTQLQVA